MNGRVFSAITGGNTLLSFTPKHVYYALTITGDTAEFERIIYRVFRTWVEFGINLGGT